MRADISPRHTRLPQSSEEASYAEAKYQLSYNQYLIETIVVISYALYCGVPVFKYIFQSAKKCEMTSFYMTALHVDLNEAAKCVDNIQYHSHC